jgi:peptide chain release factor subunit 1
VLDEHEMMQDKKLMEQFFKELHDGDLATYGFGPTRENLNMGAVETLLLSEDLRKEVAVRTCESGHTEYEFLDPDEAVPDDACSRCGDPMETEREDAIDHLIELAEQRGTETHFVSTDFEKGDQLLSAFGGVAGILRYSTGV